MTYLQTQHSTQCNAHALLVVLTSEGELTSTRHFDSDEVVEGRVHDWSASSQPTNFSKTTTQDLGQTPPCQSVGATALETIETENSTVEL